MHCLDIIKPKPIDPEINPYCKIDEKLVTFFQCDITKHDEVSNALKGVDTVFHVCSITDIRLCPCDAMENVNVNGTATIMRACRVNKVKQLIYTSSIEAVNDGKIKDQSKEDLPWVTGYNPYGTTKTLSEKLVLKACDGLAVSILRLAHIYGPGDPILYATVNMPFNIGDGKCKHSFIYIENCAYAHIETAKALASKKEGVRGECDNQIFNIKDHDENFIKWYRDILCEKGDIWAIYFPYMLAIVLAYIYDFVIWALFKLFGLRIGGMVVELHMLVNDSMFCFD